MTTPAQTVDITAPSDLPGGYELHVNVGNDPMIVTVPADGVKEGQSFAAVPRPVAGATAVKVTHGDIPTERFRDGFCDCCKYFCHAIFWCSCCCNPCALAQVMTRMGLDWGATPKANRRGGPSAFVIILAVTISFCIGVGILNSIQNQITSGISGILCLGYLVYILFVTVRTRGYIRKKYNIRGSCCCDCCASYWCHCCVVSQMASHTADPLVHKSKCCTETGLDSSAPDIV